MTTQQRFKLADQTTPKGFRNPLGYYCAPNGADPTYVSERNFARFVAFGLFISHIDQDDLPDHAVGNDDITTVRKQFLDTVENAIKQYDEWERKKKWCQDEPVGETVDLYLKGTEDAEDHDDIMTVAWYLHLISADGDWCFDLTFTGGDPTSPWLAAEVLDTDEKRQDCLAAITEARTLLGYEQEGNSS